jgi:uncharacterized damage-inducible protein DinB
MTMSRPLSLGLILAAAAATPAQGQSAPTDYRDEFLRHFRQSTDKIMALAQAMPESLYAWSPGAGVMSVARVYAHIARYNFGYPADALGIPAPSDLDLRTMEDLTDKRVVLEVFRRSVEHVRTAAERMSEADLTRMTRLYGRDVPSWSVLLQLLAHMNEHVGQSIAYARMNGIVPPWSR